MNTKKQYQLIFLINPTNKQSDDNDERLWKSLKTKLNLCVRRSIQPITNPLKQSAKPTAEHN